MSNSWLFPGYPPQGAATDERYTPAWVFHGLDLAFDLDPASPVDGGDCVPARRKLTSADDGLTAPWDGLVWLNPPFSNLKTWANRMVAHRCGVFLGPVANGAWVQTVVGAADLLWLCRDIAFCHPVHGGRHCSMPLFFAAFGPSATAGLGRLAGCGRHEGTLLARVSVNDQLEL